MARSPFTHQQQEKSGALPGALMGIVNVTPNSFSDGGRYAAAPAAVGHAARLVEAGAAFLDVGAEASSFFRAGVEAVAAEEQLARLLPVLQAWGAEPRAAEAVVSVDTRSAAVARAVLRLRRDGHDNRRVVEVINDISAGLHEPALLEVVAEEGAGLVLMHIGAGYPATPAHDDAEVVASVCEFLSRRVEAALAAGVPRDGVAIDPGIGFGKTMADNWRLLAACADVHRGPLRALGFPLIIGASRKRFLETAPPLNLLPEWPELLAQVRTLAADLADAQWRDVESAAVTRMAAAGGPAIHRVHHVTLAQRALTMCG